MRDRLEAMISAAVGALATLVGAAQISPGIGAGAGLRQPVGLAVVGGLMFSQAITLYFTPLICLALGPLQRQGAVSAVEGSVPKPAASD